MFSFSELSVMWEAVKYRLATLPPETAPEVKQTLTDVAKKIEAAIEELIRGLGKGIRKGGSHEPRKS